MCCYFVKNINIKFPLFGIIKYSGGFVSNNIMFTGNMTDSEPDISGPAPFPYFLGHIIAWEGMGAPHVTYICYSSSIVSHDLYMTVCYFSTE